MEPCRIPQMLRFFGTDAVYLEGSGTGALINVLVCLKAAGKDVLMPAMTCPNVAIAVWAAGARPVFVDIDAATGNMDPEQLSRSLHPGVAAVIVVHSFGYPAPLSRIRALCGPIPLIEDACQAYGGRESGRALGTLGDIGLISFGYAKPIPLGRGAAIIINRPDLTTVIKDSSVTLPQGLQNLRYRLAMNLMIRGHNRVIRWLAKNANLYGFGLPREFEDELQHRWCSFESSLPALQAELAELPALLERPDIIRCDYTPGTWLPWRYSFRVSDERFRRGLLRVGRAAGLSLSTLYRPVTTHFNAGADAVYPAAQEWSRTAVNLVYDNSAEGIRHMKRQLQIALERAQPA